MQVDNLNEHEMGRGKKKPFRVFERKDGYYWHAVNVKNDDEFIRLKEELLKHFEDEIGQIPHGDTAENLRELGYSELAKKFKNLLNYFDIYDGTFWRLVDDSEIINPVPVFMTLKEDNGNKYIALRIDPDVTRQEYIDMWSWVENVKKDMPGSKEKNRTSEDHELLYAIHRARKSKMTYKKISEELEKGTLPLYRKKLNRNYDDLIKFYNRNHFTKKDT